MSRQTNKKIIAITVFLLILNNIASYFWYKYYQPQCAPCLPGYPCPPCRSTEQYVLLVISPLLDVVLIVRMWIKLKKEKV